MTLKKVKALDLREVGNVRPQREGGVGQGRRSSGPWIRTRGLLPSSGARRGCVRKGARYTALEEGGRRPGQFLWGR